MKTLRFWISLAAAAGVVMLAPSRPDAAAAGSGQAGAAAQPFTLTAGEHICIIGNQLAERMPLLDVRFFVTAVLIQRDTGGNLAEILDNLAHVVRERFKILRQVRVYTAHGRMTGYVLLALPAFLALALMFINPEHMHVLFTERAGKMMVAATVVLQTVGYLWIRKIVTIEV